MYNEKGSFLWTADVYEKGKKGPGMCVECGKCVKKCPQKINIPSELKKMKEEIDFSRNAQ